MQYTSLGRTGLQVSRLCLGTMNFGPRTSEQDSFAIMDRAVELGINFFDTADVYGTRGGTEQIIGRWLAQGGRRDRIVLATKAYNQMGEAPTDRGLSAYHIRRACDASLQRLQTDCIDLYQMHHVERITPWDEIWQAMEQLVRQGKVIYIGSSNFAAWDIATACQEASKRHFLGLVSEQSVYNLNNRTVELEVLPACRHYGVGVIPYSPIGGGLLGGVLDLKKGDGDRRASEPAQKRIEAMRPQLERYETLCKELGQEPANIALAWLLCNDAVTAPIIGPRTMEQMIGALRALDVELDESALTKLDEIFPGPGGEAPQAYAW